MKSESEIRAHRDALLVCVGMPCDCEGTDHEWKCREGGYMMKAAIGALSWALGENPLMDRLVGEMGRAAAEYMATGGAGE